MIAEQKKVIEELKIVKPHYSASELAVCLGIERTRYFRILNGHEMKLSEYLAAKKIIQKAFNCQLESEMAELSLNMRLELSQSVARGLRMKQLVDRINDITT